MYKLDTEDLKFYLGGISCMDLIAEGIDPVQFVKEDWIRQVRILESAGLKFDGPDACFSKTYGFSLIELWNMCAFLD